MNILIAGSSGLIGRALCPLLEKKGHRLLRLVRSRDQADGQSSLFWNPYKEGEEAASLLDGVDVVINLAGENVASSRWTHEQKQKIEESRYLTTRRLVDLCLATSQPPRLLINGSAIGYYGSQGHALLDESSPPGEGFLAQVCRRWEEEADRLVAHSDKTRLIKLRIGVVLSPEGGALAKMLPFFKLGLGGPVAGGAQYVSWIAIDDLVGAIAHAIDDQSLSGPLNGVAPVAVTNGQLTKALAKALGRPAFLPMAGWAVRLLMGQMGEELLLASTRVVPKRLEESGYSFAHLTIEEALEYLLKAKQPTTR